MIREPLVLLPLLLLACSAEPSGDSGGASGDTGTGAGACPSASLEPTVLATGFDQGTEGVSFVGGVPYVTAASGLYRVDADGTVTERTTWEHALGLAPAGDGLLVADPGDFTFDGSGDDGRLLWAPAAGGAPTVVAAGMPNPNFVMTAPWGDVLVSDDTGEVIYAVDAAGVVTTWIDGVPSPNGMALSPDQQTLYTVSTFTADPALWAIPLSAGGSPGAPAAIHTFDSGSTPDGVVVDADGGVWVALNLLGELARIDPATGERTDTVDGLSTPASMAFGTGGDFDPCSMVITSLYGSDVVVVPVGRRGGPVLDGPSAW